MPLKRSSFWNVSSLDWIPALSVPVVQWLRAHLLPLQMEHLCSIEQIHLPRYLTDPFFAVKTEELLCQVIDLFFKVVTFL